jgi:hypothetical protein
MHATCPAHLNLHPHNQSIYIIIFQVTSSTRKLKFIYLYYLLFILLFSGTEKKPRKPQSGQLVSGPILNRGPLKFETEVVTTQPRRPVTDNIK